MLEVIVRMEDRDVILIESTDIAVLRLVLAILSAVVTRDFDLLH